MSCLEQAAPFGESHLRSDPLALRLQPAPA